jgi:hypothetical protein
VLCYAAEEDAEEDYVRDMLARAGFGGARSRAGLSANGFYVCDADLEDELIRAVGVAEVVRIIKAQGEFGSFRTFGKQSAQLLQSPAHPAAPRQWQDPD